MTLDYNKMFLAVTLEAVIKGHFTFFIFPPHRGAFFMPFFGKISFIVFIAGNAGGASNMNSL